MRCNVNATKTDEILTVMAGENLGFNVPITINHPGPLLGYMAKVPENETAASWDGGGHVVCIDLVD